jgi:hypothetical protein
MSSKCTKMMGRIEYSESRLADYTSLMLVILQSPGAHEYGSQE